MVTFVPCDLIGFSSVICISVTTYAAKQNVVHTQYPRTVPASPTLPSLSKPPNPIAGHRAVPAADPIKCDWCIALAHVPPATRSSSQMPVEAQMLDFELRRAGDEWNEIFSGRVDYSSEKNKG